MNRGRTATAALTIFLFLTGCSGLIYQVLWSRYLGLLLGSSAIAVVVVLTAFMGGLAIGSWGFGRLADRPIRRLTLYAWLEIGIGFYCALYPAIQATLAGPYLRLVSPLFLLRPWAFTAARLLFAALLLLPPTVLMGGTLPAASRFLLGIEPGVRRAVARLYWVNSAGAVLGALLAGFWLVPSFGLDLSMTLAAVINVGVGVAAVALRSRIGEDPAAPPLADPAESPLSARAAAFATAAVAVSGFAALALEVVWTRLLAMALGGSTYAFTTMLSTFILGIAAGSLLVAGRWFAGRNPIMVLTGLLLVAAAALALAMPLDDKLPYAFLALRDLIRASPRGYGVYQAAAFLLCLAVMIVPTTAMGATLPIASRIAARSAHALGSRIGLTYAANTVGTLLGAVVAGLLLLPHAGLQVTMRLIIVLYVVAAGLAMLGADPGARRRAVAVGAAAVALVSWTFLAPGWRPALLASGAFRARVLEDYASLAPMVNSTRVLSHADGSHATVTVVEYDGQRTLRVNGKPDASTSAGDMRTQLLLGHVPGLLAPAGAERALVIGIGSGTTVGALAEHAGIRVDAVEIEPEVVRAARDWFKGANRGGLERPNVRVYVEDAKTFLLLAREPYDVIVSEPSNPWVAGIGGLFTQEYFQLARSKLRPGGILAQWIHSYELSDENERLVLRTFRKAFPYTTVWQSQPSDYFLIGSDRPLRPDAEELERRMAVPGVRDSLARIGVNDLVALLGHQVLSESSAAVAAGAGPLNSDRFPVLEFRAPLDFFLNTESRVFADMDERRQLGNRQLLVSRYLAQRPIDSVHAYELAQALAWHRPLSESLLRAAHALDHRNARAASALARLLLQNGRPLEARAVLAATPAGQEAESLRLLIDVDLASCAGMRSAFVSRAECDDAVRVAERLMKLPDLPASDRRMALARLAGAQLWSGRAAESAASYDLLLRDPASAAEPPSRRAAWLAGYAAARLAQGKADGAEELARDALRLDPRQPSAQRLLAGGVGLDESFLAAP